MRRKPGKMHLENRSHESVLGQSVDWNRVRPDAADKLRISAGTGRFDAREREPRAIRLNRRASFRSCALRLSQ